MKKGFTLVELLVSISVFGLIAMLMFGTIDNLRKQLGFYKEKEIVIVHKNRILSLMRSDFDRPQTLTVLRSSDKSFDTVSINGSNRSLYGIHLPNVLWVVLKNDNTLVRLESASPLSLPLNPDTLYQVHSDVIGKDCEIFRLYDSKGRRLAYLKFSNHPPLVLETAK